MAVLAKVSLTAEVCCVMAIICGSWRRSWLVGFDIVYGSSIEVGLSLPSIHSRKDEGTD